MAQQWQEGRVTSKLAWSQSLFSLRVAAEIEPYSAGQFTKLGLAVDGEIVARPYSLVNAPDQHPLDFTFSVVPNGPLSARLAALVPGDRILVAPRAAGFLVLDEVPPAAHLWLIATGTGIGPFLSILRTPAPWGRFDRVTLVHAVRHANELIYADTVRAIAATQAERFSFVPFVSREATDYALAGRVPQAIADGRLEQQAGLRIGAETSQIMLCGNPKMVDDTTEALMARGLKRHRRRDPGHISVENYW
jgi:ferredoxin--NADP+ reductase